MARQTDGPPEAQGPAPLPFRHPVPVAQLDETDAVPFAIAPDDAARAAIARFLDVEGVGDLTFKGRIMPAEARGRAVEGRVQATVRQTCVVTLEPVETLLDLEVSRRFLPNLPESDEAEIELDAEDENAPEPLGREIELGQIMIESLVLAIDPYPRAPGAEHGARVYGPPGAEPLTDEAARPFAPLSALRKKLGSED